MAGFFKHLVVLMLVSTLLAITGLGAPVYPLKPSANKRYLMDQNNTPFLVVGDSPHSLVANLNTTDAATYLYNRATNGFNSLWVEVLCFPYAGGRANGSLLNGTLPFNNTLAGGYYDITTPNPSYFSQVDAIVSMADTNNLVLFLDPIETGGWLQTMTNNGSNSCWIYGQYLGNRYKNFTNIVWLSGNDYNVAYWSVPTNDMCVKAVASGIKSMDTSLIHTIELGLGGSAYSIDDSLADANWNPMISIDLIYSYSSTYWYQLRGYNRTNYLPCVNGEQHYESEDNGETGGDTEVGTPYVLRKQEYWVMLSGGCGQLCGNHYIWPFLAGWQNNLNTVGVQQLQYNTALFQSRAWYNLVPDQNHSLVTAGYGTFATNGLISTNQYATAAMTPDGTLAIVYVPTNFTITVAMSNMAASATAQWYDPTSGTYSTVAGSPFANTGSQNFTTPGNNSTGAGDWALVMQAQLTNSVPGAPTDLRVLPP